MSYLNVGDRVDVHVEDGVVLRLEVLKIDDERNLMLIRVAEVMREQQDEQRDIPFP
jgi:hypothetical protein